MSKEMMKMRFLYLTTRGLLSVASLTGLHALVGLQYLMAQYRPLEVPKEYKFLRASPAYEMQPPYAKMGDFRAGLSVEVLEEHAATGKWAVRYKRYGAAAIQCLINPPNLALDRAAAFERVRELIEAFPLLQLQLEARQPWPRERATLIQQLFGRSENYSIISGSPDQPGVIALKKSATIASVWGMSPLTTFLEFNQAQRPRLVFELWSKGDAYQTQLNPSRAVLAIRQRLEQIDTVFRQTLTAHSGEVGAAIGALDLHQELTLLPNQVQVVLRYKKGEYLIVEIQPAELLQASDEQPLLAIKDREALQNSVTVSQQGHVYVANIPMIDQGKKGYCAAATLARVLQYYGYAVDQHALAELAETEGQASEGARGGTHRRNIIRAMQRVCNGTPFRLKSIRKTQPQALLAVIEQGIPIIWFVPGHARLLTGVHPSKNEIVFSDTWGAAYNHQIGTWDYFCNHNVELWYLEP